MQLSEELARSLLEAAPDATVVVDSAGRIVYANTQIRQLFGHAPDELVGAAIEVLLPERFKEIHASHRNAFFGSPKLRPMGIGLALYGLHKSGREFPVEVSLSPVTVEHGRTLVVAAIRDATLHKRTESQLIEANRSKSRFLAAASHDLRQPLQTLNLLNRAARREAAGHGQLLAIIDRQQHALDSMSGLLASVLDISKLDSGAVVPNVTDCSIDDIFAQLAADFGPQAAEKGLKLEIERCGEATRSDRELLRRLLGNLLSNSIRYTMQGEVRLRCIPDGESLDIEVSDTGIGIAHDELERIFEEFYQVDHGSRRPEGLGLGLSIVRRLADLLGLHVEVDSIPDQGTRFTIKVPRCALSRATETPTPSSVGRGTGSILVIDDEQAVAEATSLLLEIEGFDVRIASCMDEALAHARARPPDLMVSDYYLRAGETGLAVVTAVREIVRREVPTIFLTGDTARNPLDSAALPHARVLTKPLRGDELLEAITAELVQPATN